MRRILYIACATSTFIICARFAEADVITLTAIDQGWYDSTGFHESGNVTYLAGKIGTTEFRNFFAFDLAAVTGDIVSATLLVDTAAYNSLDGTETYSLFDVSTPIATLMAGGTGLTAIHTDLGTGALLGTRIYEVGDSQLVREIAINATGIGALQAAIGGQFAFGGAVTSLAGNPSNQFLFSLVFESAQLRVETEPPVVPEPASLLLLGTGLASLAVQRYRKRS